MRKRISTIIMTTLMALSLTACGGAAQSTSASKGAEESAEATDSTDSNMKLKVIATPAPASCSQVAVAEELGYFKEEGVDVEIQYVTNLSDMASIIAGGGCDAAFNSYYTVMTWVDSGLDVKVIAANNDMGGTQAAAIRTDIDIKSPKDLENCKLGLVPGAEVNVAIMRMCDEYDVDFDAINKVEVQPADQLSAFESGDIDIIACWEPWLTKAESMGGRFLLSGNKADIEGVPSDVDWLTLYETTVCPTSAVTEKADALAAMLRAVKKAEDYINSNRDEAVKIVAKVCESEESEIAGIMEKNDYRWGVDSQYKETMSSLEDFMFEHKIIQNDIEFDSIHDFSILKKAVPEAYTLD
ncbi:MAG: ABC transporter substrate-binding protein [Eubacteriales bacterium]|nr:ABC transporter substrate-binding protein [Eubacteriales bacterium]